MTPSSHAALWAALAIFDILVVLLLPATPTIPASTRVVLDLALAIVASVATFNFVCYFIAALKEDK